MTIFVFQRRSIVMKPLTTLIIPTYNWPSALNLVLLSVKNQTVYPDEVIIADDGSNDETKQLIVDFQKDFPVTLKHIWHKDDGFRKTVIMNTSVAQALGDYIIQIDGDCILHKNFIEDHLNAREKTTYLFGSRVSIQAPFVETILKNKKFKFSSISRGLKKRGRSLYIPILAKRYKRDIVMSKKVRGCNLSYWKKDFIAVNGYNEGILGWGREDTELVLRLVNNGIFGKRLKFRGIVYHIWHEVKSKSNLEKNHNIQAETIANKTIWIENGIDKYLSEKN